MTEPRENYLWNGSGAPDAEVEHLEKLLSAFRTGSPELDWSRVSMDEPDRHRPANRLIKRMWIPATLVVAALAVLAVTLAIRSRFEWRPGEPWTVRVLHGSPQIGGAPTRGRGNLSAGQVLATDSSASARIHVADLGVVDVMPNSRLRLITTNAKRHRVALEYGTISAHMWAPPFSLAVDTPSAALVDLGCAFTLHVDQDGSGIVKVSSGWVQFETDAMSVAVPAGAEAVTRRELGPGTPYFSDSSAAFKAAIDEFDSHPDNDVGRATALQSIVSLARPRDAFTLLNLLKRLPRQQRATVLDRLAVFVPIPVGYTADDILDVRQEAMDAYWKALHLGNPKSWVMNWKDALGY